MKIGTLAGAGIGGGASGLTQIVVRLALKTPTSNFAKWVATHPATTGAIVGLIGAGGLYLVKKKEAAVGALVGAVVASAPGVLGEFGVGVPSAAAQAGFGLAVAQQRGFGSPPTVELFGASPDQIQLLGTSGSGQAALGGQGFNAAAFGGQSY